MIKSRYKVVKQIDYSKVDFVVCTDKSYFKDSKIGYCAKCGEKLVFRPYIPDDVVKIHIWCYRKENEN